MIRRLDVNGVSVGVYSIHEAVYNHFVNHLKSLRFINVDVDSLQFSSFDKDASRGLVRHFIKEEIKQAR